MVYIITGKSGAGKTTMARHLIRELEIKSRKVFWLDGDIWRDKCSNKNFTEEGVYNNIMSAVDCALKNEKDYDDIILSFILPYHDLRQFVRYQFNESVTIYVPGGRIWFGTEYQTPEPQEMGYFKK